MENVWLLGRGSCLLQIAYQENKKGPPRSRAGTQWPKSASHRYSRLPVITRGSPCLHLVVNQHILCLFFFFFLPAMMTSFQDDPSSSSSSSLFLMYRQLYRRTYTVYNSCSEIHNGKNSWHYGQEDMQDNKRKATNFLKTMYIAVGKRVWHAPRPMECPWNIDVHCDVCTDC